MTPTYNKKQFCKRLRYARLNRCSYRPIQIDKMLDFPKGMIKSFEEGEAEPTTAQLSKLANFYRRDLLWFFEETEPKDPVFLWCKGR